MTRAGLRNFVGSCDEARRTRAFGLDPLILASLVFMSLGVTVLGLFLDARDFLIALCASVLSIVLAGFAAVYLFDRLTEQQNSLRRAGQWKEARRATLAAVWEQALLMTEPIREVAPDHLQYAILLPEGIIKRTRAVEEWAREQTNNRHGKGRTKSDGTYEEKVFTDMIIGLHGAVSGEYQYLRNVLTPRILEFGSDTALLGRLFDIEAADRQWSGIVRSGSPGIIDAQATISPGDAWAAIADFCGAVIRLLEYLSEDPDHYKPESVRVIGVGTADGRWVNRMWGHYKPPNPPDPAP